jgi:hypothetical protein
MTDPIRLAAPLPGDALAAELTWQAPRRGLRPGDEAVARDAAAHAELRLQALSGKWETRRLTVAEADAWLAEAEALRASTAAFDARVRERTEARSDARAELAARIVPRCPYCERPRRYEGLRQVVTAERPEELARADSDRARHGARGWHEYACPDCGSVELFAAGALEHPLPGVSASD